MHQLLQFTLLSSSVPSSCKKEESSPLCSGRQPDLEPQGQQIHQALEARATLHTLSFTAGKPPLAAKLREFLKSKPPTPITKPRMQVLHQPLLMLHPPTDFWRGGHALSLLTQFITKQPASLQRGAAQVFRRVEQVLQEDRST